MPAAGPRRVVVTGIGPVTPVGLGRRAFWEALTSGRSGVRPIEGHPDLPVRVVAPVEAFRPHEFMDRKAARRTSRFVQLAMAAGRLAWEDAARPEVRPQRAGVVLSTALTGVDQVTEQDGILARRGPERVSAFAIPSMMPNAAPAQVAIELGLAGPNLSIASGDAGGVQAVGEGYRYVREGALDVCLVGGTDAPLVPVVLAALARTGAVTCRGDAAGASRPFDASRDGFVPAEGACVLVLEEAQHAEARGATAYAEVAGYGIGRTNGDEALGAHVVQSALAGARAEPEEVDVVVAAAPSTQVEDAMETRVLKKALGRRAHSVAISAPRSMTGHLLGASGAVDAAVAALALHTGVVPPTLNLEEPDPECDLDYVPGESRRVPARLAIADGLGLGGQHATVALRRL